MKRARMLLCLLLAVMLTAALQTVTAHAAWKDQPCKACGHTDWELISEDPDICTGSGTRLWQCNYCYRQYTETVSAQGHKWSSWGSDPTVQPPTCTSPGQESRHCSRCGEREVRNVPALGHSWGSWMSGGDPRGIYHEPPTCTEQGSEFHVCSRCGEMEDRTASALGHAWNSGTVTKKPTCTATGARTRECTRCGKTKTETVAALGHSWNGGTVTQKPSCGKTGVRTYKCTACGETKTETVAALTHSWDGGTVTQKPTCGKAGVRTYKCSNCGQTKTEAIAALEHEWDKGVTTQPHGLFEGKTVYTCLNCGNTKEEAIPVDPAVIFATLHNLPPDGSTSDLRITEQPEGGYVIKYSVSYHTMHVKAEGGEGEYTYEWHSSAQEIGQKQEYNDFLKWLVGLFGVTPEQVDEQLQTSLSSSDSCTVSEGDMEYWCVVTDEAGNHVESDRCTVSYGVRIAQQPENVNLQSKGPHTLTCIGADGSGSYTYMWLDGQGNEVDTGSTITVTEPGEYMCVVRDDLTGQVMTSEKCKVYAGDPFTIDHMTGDCEMWPGDEGLLVASFMGGVEPYTVRWEKDGEPFPCGGGRNEKDLYYTSITTWEGGAYTMYAEDSLHEKIQVTVIRKDKTLTISQQPVGGTIPRKGHLEINVLVEDGTAPYTFILYRNGEDLVRATSDTATPNGLPFGFNVWYPGVYYFHITDSEGHYVDSDAVLFQEETFRVKSQTESEAIVARGATARLSVEAEGGAEPYSYKWIKKSLGRWFSTGKTGSSCEVEKIGEYACVIEDSEGNVIRTATIPVTYTGAAPWITLQPKNGMLKKDEAPPLLSCTAITAEGHGVRYEWYRGTTERKSLYNRTNWTRFAYGSDKATVPGAGLYRCKVTDTETNGWVWSEIVTVSEELTYTLALEYHDQSHEDIFSKLTIKGGTGPYTIRLYRNVPVYNNEKKESEWYWALEHEEPYITNDSGYHPNWLDGISSHAHINSNTGKMEMYTYWPSYYFVITDANGNSVTTEEFSLSTMKGD